MMACYIFGAGSFYGLETRPGKGDFVIAADGGWYHCQRENILPDLLLGDFDSLDTIPDFPQIFRVPVEKDDTDMMLAVKLGLQRGETLFHLYGGLGGNRTDHTIANLQTLVYLAQHGAQGWLYGQCERFTAIHCRSILFPAQDHGILSVFCMGSDAASVTISGAQYELENALLTASFPLGVSNHFIGHPIRVSVSDGTLLVGLHTEEPSPSQKEAAL